MLVEKDTHPRFHIGELLLPMNLPLFEQLGVKEAIDRIGMPKYGVEFVSPWHDNTTMLDFAQSWDKNLFYSYEVRRSEFDHILLRNAAAKGALSSKAAASRQVEFPPEGGVVATGQDGDGRARRFARKIPGGRVRPRHAACRPPRHQATQSPPRQRRGVRTFHRRAAAAWQGCGQYQHLLVRARLVLVHSARRRHHQRRRRLPAGVHEVAQDRRDQLPGKPDRSMPGAWPNGWPMRR